MKLIYQEHLCHRQGDHFTFHHVIALEVRVSVSCDTRMSVRGCSDVTSEDYTTLRDQREGVLLLVPLGDICKYTIL